MSGAGLRGARRCFGDPRSHPPPPRPRGRGGGGGETRGDLLLLFLMLLLMAKKATWSFLPSARRDPPPIPTSFRTCLLHPQQEADLVVFLETEGISSLFSSLPRCCFCFILSHFLVKGGGRERKERNSTRPWGLSSPHPPPSPPPPARRQKAPGVELDRRQIFEVGEGRLERRDRETPRRRIPVLLGFSSFFPSFPLPSFFPFFFFSIFFFPLHPTAPHPRSRRRRCRVPGEPPWGARRGARAGRRGGPRRNWDGFARSGAGGASWRPPPPAPPKSVR